MEEDRQCSFEQKLDLFKSGYSNAQDVIKFIDTKNGVISGFVTLTIGGTLAFVMWVFENAGTGAKAVYDVLAGNRHVAAAVALSVCFGAGSLFCCFRSLVGRSPPEDRYRILFPCFTPKMLNNAKAIYEQSARSLTGDLLLQEYWEQVAAVGQIIFKKLYWHRFSLIMCFAQLAAVIEGSALLILGLYLVRPVQ
jgi:hypothetical protein